MLRAFLLFVSGLFLGAIACYLIAGIAFFFVPEAFADGYRDQNWGLVNTYAHSHIHALNAWGITKGDDSIVVATVDTGVDFTHPDLQDNVLPGFDIVLDRPGAVDTYGHGTHVAGIIRGVAPHFTLLPIRYFSAGATGTVSLKRSTTGIDYAITHHARVINYSGGGQEFSEAEYLSVKRAETAGVLIVAAAGNERADSDLVQNYFYPAQYRTPNIISVAATDINNKLLASSNYGVSRVDVAAPGENIYSTMPGGGYGYMSGTSMATAFVTGTAVLLLAECKGLTPAQVRDIIMKTADRIPGLPVASGRLNAYAALLDLEQRKHYHEVRCD